MESKRIKIKMCTILIGGISIMGLIAFLLLYRIYSGHKEVTPEVHPEETTREENIPGYKTPTEVVGYILYQLQQGDLDLALRGCAIEELATEFSLPAYIEITQKFPYTTILPPVQEDNAYHSIAMAELSASYAKDISRVAELMGKGQQMEIKEINLYQPQAQLSNEFRVMAQKTREITGAQNVSEVMAMISIDGEVKQWKCTVAQYKEYWKLLSFDTLDHYEMEKNDFTVITQEEYEAQKDSAAEKTLLSIYKAGKLEEDLEEEDLEEGEKAILPINYFIVNQASEDKAEETIRRFYRYLQKQEVIAAMTYMYTGDSNQNASVTMELLDRQSEMARDIQKFYYGLLGYQYQTQSAMLVELGRKGKGIAEDLATTNMIYTDVQDIIMVSQNETEIQCKVCYEYEGEYFVSGYTLVNQEGWRISSLSSEKAGIANGEVKKLTKKQHEELIGD